jgi:hypothetical protein
MKILKKIVAFISYLKSKQKIIYRMIVSQIYNKMVFFNNIYINFLLLIVKKILYKKL